MPEQEIKAKTKIQWRRSVDLISDDYCKLLRNKLALESKLSLAGSVSSAVDVSMTSTLQGDRVLEALNSEVRSIPRTRGLVREPLEAVTIWTPGDFCENWPDVDVYDECWSVGENLGLMVKVDGKLDEEPCSETVVKAPEHIVKASPCIARVVIVLPSAEGSPSHRGTAVHIGNGYFLTVAHVLRYPTYKLSSNKGQSTTEAIDPFCSSTKLKMSLIRPKSGVDAFCTVASAARNLDVTQMSFEIIAFSSNITLDIEGFVPHWHKALKQWRSAGHEGFIPLPNDYVPPREGDIALLRVVKEDRSLVKTAFALPGRLRSVQKDAPLAWIGINGQMSPSDMTQYPTWPQRQDYLNYINQLILRSSRVSFFGACRNDLKSEKYVSGGYSLRFNTSKGSSGSGIFAFSNTKDPQPLIIGLLQSSLHQLNAPSNTRVLFFTWEQPLIKKFIKDEIIPRFRRADNAAERWLFRQSNTISEYWQDMLRD